jgi:hypothetical protein
MTDPLRSVAVGPSVPADVCPLCGAGNACAMAGGGEAEGSCWCVGVAFGTELLERVPPAARGRACICAACAAAARGSAAATGDPA